MVNEAEQPLVLGLYSSQPGSGKSAVAAALADKGFVRVPFAGTLKAMGAVLLEALGFDPLYVQKLITEDKQKPLDCLDGVTVRQLLQTLGTEWGRQQVHPEIWLRCWMGQVERVLADGRPVVVDDVRFINEAALIEQLGNGVMVRIIRPTGAIAGAGGHASEGGLDQWPFAAEMINNSSLDALRDQAQQLVQQLEGR